MVRDKKDVVGKSVFNPAQKYIESLALLMDRLDGVFLVEDTNKIYAYLMRLYSRVAHKLSKEERKEILAIRLKVTPFLSHPLPIKKAQAMIDLEEFDLQLKEFMDRYGLLIPSADDPAFASYE